MKLLPVSVVEECEPAREMAAAAGSSSSGVIHIELPGRRW